MHAVYLVDDQHFKFFEEQARELQSKNSQSIITSVFQALTGIRHKERKRQVTTIPPTPVTMGTGTPS